MMLEGALVALGEHVNDPIYSKCWVQHIFSSHQEALQKHS